eukprot:6924551-Prymnesium_polylepis.1
MSDAVHTRARSPRPSRRASSERQGGSSSAGSRSRGRRVVRTADGEHLAFVVAGRLRGRAAGARIEHGVVDGDDR